MKKKKKTRKSGERKGFIACASRLNNDYQHCLSFLSCLIGESLCQKPSKASVGTLVCCRTKNVISLISEISSQTEIHGRKEQMLKNCAETKWPTGMVSPRLDMISGLFHHRFRGLCKISQRNPDH